MATDDAFAGAAVGAPVSGTPRRITTAEFEWDSILGFTDKEVYNPAQLVYGLPGRGKTTYVAGAVAAGLKPLILDCDLGGTFTLRGQHIPRIGIESWPKVEYTVQQLVDGKARNYDVIGLDTASMLQDTCWNDVTGNTGRGRGKDVRQEWQVVASRMHYVIRQLKLTGVPLVVLAHERQYKDDEGKLTGVAPALTPAVYKSISALVELIGRLMVVHVPGPNGKRQPIRRLWVGEHDIYEAKLRNIPLPEYVDNPTFAGVWAKIVGKESKNAKKA